MAHSRMLADAVLLVHAAYICFVVFGLIAILIAGAADWRWVRNFKFRAIHLAAIALVLAESLVGVMCPLTVLEDSLRTRAGQSAYSGDFIAYWLDAMIFHAWPAWVFTALYAAFTLAVLASWRLVPPTLPWRRKPRRTRIARLPG